MIFAISGMRSGEKLMIYNPVDITSNEKELKIKKASKVKWSYIPYGNHVTRKVITYVWENNRVRKFIDEKETFCGCENTALAVLLGGY